MFTALSGPGSFVSHKYKLFVHAPPKCASTSILTALVRLGNPNAEITNDASSENLSSLDIHPYVRDHCRPTEQCLRDIFASSDFCKILVLRDPLSRFLSAIASKYLIGSGPYAQELTQGSTIKYELKKNYSDIQNLKDDVNFVSKRLLTALSLGTGVTHVKPLSGVVSNKDLPLFDNVFNVSDSGFSEAFLTAINLHLHQFGVAVDRLPRFNESPLNIPVDFLESSCLDSILEFYHNDYILLGKDLPKSSDILSSDFDFKEFAQKNSDKLSSSVLFYDVSSKFFQKDLIAKELGTKNRHLERENNEFRDKINISTLEKEKALAQVNNLNLETEKALASAQKLQEKSLDQNKEIKQLKLAVDELTENDKYRILHIAQLQEDLNQLKSFKDILKKQQLQISNLVDMLLHASL